MHALRRFLRSGNYPVDGHDLPLRPSDFTIAQVCDDGGGRGGVVALGRLKTTLSVQLLQGAGWHTAIVGKWGLGFNGTTGAALNKGWDTYYGMPDQNQVRGGSGIAHCAAPPVRPRRAVPQHVPHRFWLVLGRPGHIPSARQRQRQPGGVHGAWQHVPIVRGRWRHAIYHAADISEAPLFAARTTPVHVASPSPHTSAARTTCSRSVRWTSSPTRRLLLSRCSYTWPTRT